MRTLLIACLASILIAGAAVEAGANTTGAEWNIDTSLKSAAFFGGTGVTAFRAQTVTMVAGGRVASIWLRIGRATDHQIPLRLSVYAVDSNGKPAGSALMTADFAPDGMPVGFTDAVAFDFDAAGSAVLDAGEQYALVVGAATESDTSPFYLNGGSAEEATYEGGQAFYSSDAASWFGVDLDFSFKIVVDETVPVRPVSWGDVKRLY